ncbi:hypothetical protein Hamer_G015182 [Homarus americanus]|uniref:Uncharacterized protein n=1 Tax=Homarus americanus TaxID=6706 RepID=A0A8J5TID4_HOMAM|nr:hypothetical protein Hamer_G015182 [Homarus americanus]
MLYSAPGPAITPEAHTETFPMFLLPRLLHLPVSPQPLGLGGGGGGPDPVRDVWCFRLFPFNGLNEYTILLHTVGSRTRADHENKTTWVLIHLLVAHQRSGKQNHVGVIGRTSADHETKPRGVIHLLVAHQLTGKQNHVGVISCDHENKATCGFLVAPQLTIKQNHVGVIISGRTSADHENKATWVLIHLLVAPQRS